MLELVRTSGLFLLLFVASILTAWLITKLALAAGRLSLVENTPLRIKTGDAFYRAYFLRDTAEGWVFTAPLQRDSYVPLRVGEDLLVEAPTPAGVVRFRSKIVNRVAGEGLFVVERPTRLKPEDRREWPRLTNLEHLGAKVEGSPVSLVDLSAHGARVKSKQRIAKGERVRLDLADRQQPVYGWVLESRNEGCDYTLRLRFEDGVELR